MSMSFFLDVCFPIIQFIWLTYLWTITQRKLEIIELFQDRVWRTLEILDSKYFDKLDNLEKKISERTGDVEEVRKAFKDFQAKFMELEERLSPTDSSSSH